MAIQTNITLTAPQKEYFQRFVNLSANDQPLPQGDATIRISPFDDYFLFTLFDEVDGYSIKQQRRLKSWLNRSDVVCVMTTNYIEDIDKGLRSRCFEVEFNASSNISDYVMRLRQILHQHNMPLLNDTQLYQIVQRADGDWREMCATMQRVCANISTQPTQPKGLRVV